MAAFGRFVAQKACENLPQRVVREMRARADRALGTVAIPAR